MRIQIFLLLISGVLIKMNESENRIKNSLCVFCGSCDYQELFRGVDLLLGGDVEYRWVRCSSCGALRQDPMPSWSDLKNSYPFNYSSYATLLPQNATKFQRITKRLGQWKRVNFVQKHRPDGCWLDIGSGSGQILQEANFRNRWQLHGLEPNKYAAQYSNSHLGIPIKNFTIEEMPLNDERYDIITMWDVLEHLSNPTQIIDLVSKLLNNNGVLIFQVPNLASLDRRVFGKFWNGYDLPRHLNLFPNKVIQDLLVDKGFQVTEKACLAGTFESYLLSIKFFNVQRKSPILKFFTENFVVRIGLKIITYPLVFIIDRLKLGTYIAYVAKKGC